MINDDDVKEKEWIMIENKGWDQQVSECKWVKVLRVEEREDKTHNQTFFYFYHSHTLLAKVFCFLFLVLKHQEEKDRSRAILLVIMMTH